MTTDKDSNAASDHKPSKEESQAMIPSASQSSTEATATTTTTTTQEKANSNMEPTVITRAAPIKMAWGKPAGIPTSTTTTTVTAAQPAQAKQNNGGQKKASLLSIMAEEAEISHANKLIQQDDAVLKAAMEASLMEQPVSQDVSTTASSEEDEIQRAIRLSLEQEASSAAVPAAAVAPSADANDAISEAEMELIQKALKEAEARELAESFQLALHLQDQENSKPSAAKHVSVGSTQLKQGHVRTMTRAEYLKEQEGGAVQPPPAQSDLDPYDDDGAFLPEEAGFRINSSKASQWARVDSDAIMGPNKEIRTKHDPRLQAQANAHRMQLDFEDGPIHVGNKAFNSFRSAFKKRTVKGVAAHGHGRANTDAERTREGALDGTTRLEITKAINNGLIEKFNGTVKEGKEAMVYHALQGTESGGHDVAIKVFKRIQEFRNRGDYVTGDTRFTRKNFSKAGPREQLGMWTEKEYRNLIRAERSGVPVPKPLSYNDNVLFMRFLGEEGWPSPQLREIDIKKGSKKWTSLYEQTMEAVQLLYTKAHLVHGDLSEYNILVCPSKLMFDDPDDKEALQVALIDFGQAVNHKHPNAEKWLRRDLQRVQEFFERMGITCIGLEAAYHYVTTEGAPLRS